MRAARGRAALVPPPAGDGAVAGWKPRTLVLAVPTRDAQRELLAAMCLATSPRSAAPALVAPKPAPSVAASVSVPFIDAALQPAGSTALRRALAAHAEAAVLRLAARSEAALRHALLVGIGADDDWSDESDRDEAP